KPFPREGAVLYPFHCEAPPKPRILSRKCEILGACPGPRRTAPLCCVWMRRAKSRRSIGRNRFCRWRRVWPLASLMITSGMALRLCLRRCTSLLAGRSALATEDPGIRSCSGLAPRSKKTFPPGLNVHLVMDKYGTHKGDKVRNWLARHPRYHVHFTPTSGSWLTLVERLFAEVTERCVRRGSHTRIRSLEKAMLDYLDQRNTNPKPFVWTADADLILGKVERLCKRISP